MTNYRNSKLIERYEDLVFELETALDVNPGANAHQTKTGHRFIVNNTGESTPFDWYNARLNVDFKLQKLNNGGNIIDQDGIVKSASSLIKRLTVKMNGIDVYDCSEANQATSIKNLLEYSQGYVKSQATNEFFILTRIEMLTIEQVRILTIKVLVQGTYF